MSAATTAQTHERELQAFVGLPVPPTGERMFAITFDLDQEALRQSYPGPSHTNAYVEIRRILIDEGFEWTQDSVYFGGTRIDAVTAVLAAQRLARELPWFSVAVRDIRMLRVEDNNDLSPAITQR